MNVRIDFDAEELWDWMEAEWRANNDGADLPKQVFALAVVTRWLMTEERQL